MQHTGLRNIHVETWPLSHGWQRGHAFAELSTPYRIPLNVTSYGWTGSTIQGGARADVLAVNSDLIPDEIAQHARLWKGNVLFLTPMGPRRLSALRSFSQLGSLLNAATKAHAVAVIYPTGRPGLLVTHTGPAALRDAYFPIPVLDIAKEQADLLNRLLFKRAHVSVKLDVQNTVTGPQTSSNVIGEIQGYEHPDEVVVVAANLDSWDLATGSVEDAFGVAAVLASADSIAFQRIRPRRTIRFILFTGEEEGLLGSLAYIRAHKTELSHIVCAFVLNWGSGPITKLPLAGHDELEEDFSHFARIDADLAPLQVDHSYLPFTDGYAFTLSGIPGIAPLQDSPNLATVGHSAADTMDRIEFKDLVLDTTILATAAFWVANYPVRLTKPWSAQQTMTVLSRDGQRPLLDLFGFWNVAARR